MKVLFLDIDGVLNKDGTKEKLPTIFGPFTGLDSKLLAVFKSWYSLWQDEVKIVLSSSWRLDERYDHAFTKHLNENGITWIDTTPNLGHRGEEIYHWVRHNSPTHFAIIDDTNEMAPVGKALVQTSPIKGIEAKHLRKIEQLLEL